MGVGTVSIGNLFSNAGRVVKVAARTVIDQDAFDTMSGTLRKSFKGTEVIQGELFSEAASATYVGGKGFKGFGTQLKAAAKSVEAMPKFSWKAAGKTLLLPGKEAAAAWKTGGKLAQKEGINAVVKVLSKSGAAAKGFAKGVGKAMPVIGNVVMVATEIPNIVSAFKDKGFVGGIEETVKTAVKLGAATLGGVIGSTIVPPVGTIAGFMIGNWLASKIVGKSHSEQKAEAQEEAQAQQQLAAQTEQASAAYTYNPAMFEGANPFAANPFNTNAMVDDFMAPYVRYTA